MSEKVTVAYHCDICDAFLANGSPIKTPFLKVKLTIIDEQEWATDMLKAEHMCPDCQHEVLSFMKEMRARK
ncbi:hypothetical protein ACP46_gp08 [Rhizobium phage RHEph06]|uniref:Uncharacterized protein n=2 Tax=Kleczkowskavirus RHEph4 TaxID=1921526 RepID=L7TJK0_9CAUD|nr:hypothetical protein ACP46_gp08 [Rhizobium phage RHEph06]YP_009598449.1 hypothetical protein FDH25_gp07 [Rhizobium phage RHEph04]AGC35769.1 hypothetical protein RHEph05_gp002 [Rhizobium phage RHEph05]QXV74885.1 hypothetical protein [Rhizobium phage RHEph26]AGC35693.1 hypothetical protein RHEph04_gp007 [Rhizobium phage RHEph04]AGC35850.1 hypothetical protein RHEph06_gp008 [Rhizobium phage RHEph06]